MFNGYIFANDSEIVINAGGQINLANHESDIEIQNETIEMETGFPQFENVNTSNRIIYDFDISYSDGTEIPYTFVPANNQIDEDLNITGWYKKKIKFNGFDTTKIGINYKSKYSDIGFYKTVNYLLGTGNTWSNSISTLEIEIVNYADIWINEVTIANTHEYDYRFIKDNHYRISKHDYEPNLSDQLVIKIARFEKYLTPPYSILGEFILEQEYINNQWLYFLTKGQLRILRNSIYAYHGYIFKSLDLNALFSNVKGYTPNKYFSESEFNECEKENIKTISNYEKDIELYITKP